MKREARGCVAIVKMGRIYRMSVESSVNGEYEVSIRSIDPEDRVLIHRVSFLIVVCVSTERINRV